MPTIKYVYMSWGDKTPASLSKSLNYDCIQAASEYLSPHLRHCPPPHKLFPQSTALHAFSVGVQLIIEHVHLSLTHASKEIDVTLLLHKFYVLRSSKIIYSHIIIYMLRWE